MVSLFLQSWRATLIVVLAIPVSLIGTFAVLYLLGYSANTLSLFAIILALTMGRMTPLWWWRSGNQNGEGLDRLAGHRPGAAADRRAVIATTLVLLAVFVPVALLPGIVGELYRQFAVTLYRGGPVEPGGANPDAGPLRAAAAPRPARPAAAWRALNRLLDGTRDGYGRLVG